MSSVEAISVEAVAGTPARLPDRMAVRLRDGNVQQRPVVWAQPDATWSTPGRVELTGAVAGTDVTATALVTITV